MQGRLVAEVGAPGDDRDQGGARDPISNADGPSVRRSGREERARQYDSECDLPREEHRRDDEVENGPRLQRPTRMPVVQPNALYAMEPVA